MNNFSNYDRFGRGLGDAAAFFRSIALEIDAEPARIERYKSHQAINNLVYSFGQNSIDRMKSYEALGYGDAGVLLACPGGSLAGVVVDEIGDPNQRNLFYQHIHTEKARTFLAVTEPEYGSNLSSINTRAEIKKGSSGILNGEKWLVGHGATGTIGVVIVKLNEGPLGIRALLLTKNDLNKTDHIQRTLLPMTGLRGARLGRLIFCDLPVQFDYLLGTHLSSVKQGMMALIKTFNRMRPCIGALAVGTAQAMIDYADSNNFFVNAEEKQKIKLLNHSISISKSLLLAAAKKVEQDPYESGLSSLAKFRATHVAEETASTVLGGLTRDRLIDHPLLEKWYRDVWGFEFMEGTRNMHCMNAFKSYQRDKLEFQREYT